MSVEKSVLGSEVQPGPTRQSQAGVLSERKVRIAMIAGEASGDILGAGLIQALKKRYPNADFEGIGGPLMQAEGFRSHVPMERLSVMGLIEVLGRIFELIGIRRRLREHFLRERPDVFIGIDAPDFNLGLEAQLRRANIKTSHYVSPSVWAWRQRRVFKIAKAVDLMLTLLPFEARFYRDHKVRVKFVGHPLADLIPRSSNKQEARAALNLDPEQPLLAILPGSRAGELKYIGETFIETARWLAKRRPDLHFVVPSVNADRREQFQAMLDAHEEAPPMTLVNGRSREVMAASDLVILASGTAALEALLLKKPMVVSYRVSKITHTIMKWLLKVPFVSLPNLLADRALVPELLQDEAQPERIGHEALRLLEPATQAAMVKDFDAIHDSLSQNASESAADAIAELLEYKDQRA
ncbi:MAG: lipid-A-disaccharide synthase [Oleiphilus sp.]|nr:MAG: lipid-A-disaccharide synthase [Oleiphilus sp.]